MRRRSTPWRVGLWAAVAYPFVACSGCTGESPPDTESAVSCGDFESPVPAEARSQDEMPPSDLRDYRYCEVLPAFAFGDVFCVEVYNTLSFNDCPEEDWAALDAYDLQAELGAEAVYLSGPRHWVVNGAEGEAGSTGSKIASFGGVQMARPGVLELQSLDDMPGVGARYVVHEVERSNTWLYSAGSEVYELFSASGEVYLMLSYSRIVSGDLGSDDLADLRGSLALPEGWAYASRVLDEDYELVSNGQAFLVQDGLANTYQRKP